METSTMIFLLIPVLVIELGVRIFTIFQIIKADRNNERFRFDSMLIWLLIVGLVNFGWIIYYIAGKVEE
jgi:hypothetical protein